ncbi:anti-sigma regulatory factor [Sutcliffiella deserti]|uniref:anti-sigma regulatory factor n=1 Tax=Sutcliffiella deserti TaxID=2875501 RepID=UPI001CBF2F88|nr:anti-sigma regulatory factor [Sutcliffiella deserti]
MNNKVGEKLEIKDEKDIIIVRKAGREIATELGFNAIDQARIATAISELARNVVRYAGKGDIEIEVISKHATGLKIHVSDQGPGIENVKKALEDGYSTSNSLGAGLPGVKRLMDEFKIDSEMNKGTEIRIVKWLRK